MQAKLRVVNGKASRSEVPLKLPVVIGRSSDAGLKIKHQLISRAHCELYEKDGYLYLRDNGSLNGTYMAGQRISEVLLNPGDQFTVGPLTFEAVYEPPATEPLAEPTTTFDSQTTLNAPTPGAMDFSALEDAVVNPADAPLEFPNFEESPAASSVEATLDFMPGETIHEKTPTVAAEIAWPTEEDAAEPEVPPPPRSSEVDMSWLTGETTEQPQVEPAAEVAEEQVDFFAVKIEDDASAEEAVEPAETFQPFAEEEAAEPEVSTSPSSDEVDMSWLTGAATEEPPVEPDPETPEEQVDFFAVKIEDAAAAEDVIDSSEPFQPFAEEAAAEPLGAADYVAPEEPELGLDFSEPPTEEIAADESEEPTPSASGGEVDFSWLAAAEPASPAVPEAIDFSGLSPDSGQATAEPWPLDFGEQAAPSTTADSPDSGQGEVRNLLQEPAIKPVEESSAAEVGLSWLEGVVEKQVEEPASQEIFSELAVDSFIPTAVAEEPPVVAVAIVEELAVVENADLGELATETDAGQEVSDLHIDNVQSAEVEPLEAATSTADERLGSVTQSTPDSVESIQVAEVTDDLDLNFDTPAAPAEEPLADVQPATAWNAPPVSEPDSASLQAGEPEATLPASAEWPADLAQTQAAEGISTNEIDHPSPNAEATAEVLEAQVTSWSGEFPTDEIASPVTASSDDSIDGPNAVWPLAGEISPLQSAAENLAAADIVSDSPAAHGTENDWNQPLSPVDESATQPTAATDEMAEFAEYDLPLSEPAAEIASVAENVPGFDELPASEVPPAFAAEIQPVMSPEPETDWLSPAAWQPIDTSSIPPLDFAAGILPSPEIVAESPAEESPVFGDNAGEITAFTPAEDSGATPDSLTSPVSPDVPAFDELPVDAGPPEVPAVSEVQFTDTDVITPAEEELLAADPAPTEEVPPSWVEEQLPSPTEGETPAHAGAIPQGSNEEYTNGFGHGIFDSPAAPPVTATAVEHDAPPAFSAAASPPSPPTWCEVDLPLSGVIAPCMAAAGPAQFTVFGRLRPHSPPVEPRPFEWVATAAAAVIEPPVWEQPHQTFAAETTAESWEDLADIEEIEEVGTVAVEAPAAETPVIDAETPVEDVAAWLQEPAIPADPWDTPAFATNPEAEPPSFTPENQPTTEEATLLWNAPPADSPNDLEEPFNDAANSLELSDLEPLAEEMLAESPSLEFAAGAPDDVGPILGETTSEWQAPADIAFEEPPPADFFSDEPIAEIQSLDETENWEDLQPGSSIDAELANEPADWAQDSLVEPAEQTGEWADAPAPPAVSTYAAPPSTPSPAEPAPAAKPKSRWWWPFGSKKKSVKPAQPTKSAALPPPTPSAAVAPAEPELPPAVPLAMDDEEEDEGLTLDLSQMAEPELIESELIGSELVEPELIEADLVEPDPIESELIETEPGMATAEFFTPEAEPSVDLGETGTFAPLPPAPLHSRRTVTDQSAFPPMPASQEPDGAFKPINFEEELAADSRKSGGKFVDDWLLAEPHATPPAKPPLDDDLNDFLKKLK